MGNIKSLNTEHFGQAELDARALAGNVSDLRNDMNACKNALLSNWFGEGRTAFEKCYALVAQQLGDISDEVYALYDALCDAEAAYLEADQSAATDIASALE